MIPTVVVDTDVLSFIFKEDTRGDLYLLRLDGKLTIISFMTLAETDRWAIERNWGRTKREAMAEFIQQFIVSPFNRPLCLRWAEAMSTARRMAGQSKPLTDGLQPPHCCTTSRSLLITENTTVEWMT